MLSLSRRRLLQEAGLGFGSIALAGLLHETGLLAGEGTASGPKPVDLAPCPGHHRPRAKAVIQLFQNGGPSQMDLFDPKPELTKRAGQPHPQAVETFQLRNKNVLLASPFKFAKHGNCGMELSEVLPHISSVADDICLIRSMSTEHNNHFEAIYMFQSGKTFGGRPVFGSYVCYALGSENRSLPAYVVLRDSAGYNTVGKEAWTNGWLPAIYQGTEFASKGSAVHHLTPTAPVLGSVRKRQLEFLGEMNREHQQFFPEETELDARIQNFELAARMQLAASEVLNISKEPEAIRRLYGLDSPATAAYGTRCLLARRLVESGVRFVQVFPPLDPSLQPWDAHQKLDEDTRTICSHVDQPSAALIKDLKQRGMLDDVLVIWAGEFGRLPITELAMVNSPGRDHNRHAFSIIMAGGGVKSGHIHGATDDFGYAVTQDRVTVPDLHATLLHQLGIDHTRLAVQHNGRAERLTDPEVSGAKVVQEILA